MIDIKNINIDEIEKIMIDDYFLASFVYYDNLLYNIYVDDVTSKKYVLIIEETPIEKLSSQLKLAEKNINIRYPKNTIKLVGVNYDVKRKEKS